MRPGGLAEVADARADGRWEAAYASQKEAEAPEDLVAALRRSPHAAAAFEALGRTDRYLLMLGVLRAGTAGSRAAQVAAALGRLEPRDTESRARRKAARAHRGRPSASRDRARHRSVPGPEATGQRVDAAEAMAEAKVETSV
ncbi:YdeI/OmpD-associated family protein [Streptomyces sp. NPDC057424]|uniref:YdeI/OmpD-associated family protein n=1 Tax=Streptomyces sp. NPDC057424 TaxID=3346127 RepID=UPI003673AF45